MDKTRMLVPSTIDKINEYLSVFLVYWITLIRPALQLLQSDSGMTVLMKFFLLSFHISLLEMILQMYCK